MRWNSHHCIRLLLKNGACISETVKAICGAHGDTGTANILSEIILEKVNHSRLKLFYQLYSIEMYVILDKIHEK